MITQLGRSLRTTFLGDDPAAPMPFALPRFVAQIGLAVLVLLAGLSAIGSTSPTRWDASWSLFWVC